MRNLINLFTLKRSSNSRAWHKAKGSSWTLFEQADEPLLWPLPCLGRFSDQNDCLDRRNREVLACTPFFFDQFLISVKISLVRAC